MIKVQCQEIFSDSSIDSIALDWNICKTALATQKWPIIQRLKTEKEYEDYLQGCRKTVSDIIKHGIACFAEHQNIALYAR